MSDPNSHLWEQMQTPITLPVIVECVGGTGVGTFHSGAQSEPYVVIQLTSLGGKVLLLPLSGAAIESIKKTLDIAEQMLGAAPRSDLPSRSH